MSDWEIQSIVFNKEYFNRKLIKNWIFKNGFVLMNNKNPIKSYENTFRVRQKNPNMFSKFRSKIIKPKKILFVYGKRKIKR